MFKLAKSHFVGMQTQLSPRLPKPPWLKIRPPTTEQYTQLREMIPSRGLVTICQEGHCPNMAECWSAGTASFMVLGDTCTRGCRFCSVKTAKKNEKISVDKFEPLKLAQTVSDMKLDYVVITSVDRDDLKDQGANHFARCIAAVKKMNPKTMVEVLTPDFCGDQKLIETVLNAKPHVFGHNIETVQRLQKTVRDRRANYEQSLSVLKMASEYGDKKSGNNSFLDSHSNQPSNKIFVKSALMLGLGEEKNEVLQTLDDLHSAGVQLLSLGQYLQPSPKHLSVSRFVSPQEFDSYKTAALEKNFLFCQSGPLVRSSYKAGEFFLKTMNK